MSHRAPRPPHRLIISLLAVVGSLLLMAVATASEPSMAQREQFRQAYAAAKQGGDSWHALATGLQTYPLYPYLQAVSLEHDIRQIDLATVQAYLKQYPDMIPAGDLRSDFLRELARRKDWTDFRQLYQPGLGDTLSCDALQAKLASAMPLDFDRDLAFLWAKPSLPGACDPVLAAAHDQGLLTTARLWTRIDTAAAAGRAGTVASLARWLPPDDATTAGQLALALRDPAAALAAADTWPDGVRQRQAVTIALTQLAPRQSSAADAAWQKLQSHFHFSTTQRDRIEHAIALFYATDFDDHALARLAALPPGAQSDSTRQWRVRVALARQDWQAALDGINAMPASQQQDGEWRYFRARAENALGHGDEAKQQYAALADQASFFGFLAADRVAQPYAICPRQMNVEDAREQVLLNRPGLLRAFELYAVDLPHFARREWNRALKGADQQTRRMAADLAHRRGWFDRAVFTFSSGDDLHMYSLRFPLAPQDGVVLQAEQSGIDPAWAYGILRAESAWQPDAHSGADARGLMQLVPATAELVAQRNGLNWNGAASLYDPATNIELGTRYLAQMAARFNGSPWLASAAYNAGPNRVDQWLIERGSLPPDLFIATIPFKETREYVARVMAFALIYDWRLHGNAVPLDTRLGAIGKLYMLPTATTPRRAIDCPTAAAPFRAQSSAPARASSSITR